MRFTVIVHMERQLTNNHLHSYMTLNCTSLLLGKHLDFQFIQNIDTVKQIMSSSSYHKKMVDLSHNLEIVSTQLTVVIQLHLGHSWLQCCRRNTYRRLLLYIWLTFRFSPFDFLSVSYFRRTVPRILWHYDFRFRCRNALWCAECLSISGIDSTIHRVQETVIVPSFDKIFFLS